MNMEVCSQIASGGFGGTLTTKQTGGSGVGFSVRKTKNRAIKKDLNYNPREISSQLVRAKRAQSASVVLVRAKSRLGLLQRALASGQYNDGEVRVAIAHARRMVECSRLKVRNLKEEEQIAGKGERQKDIDRIQKKNKAKQAARRRQQELKTEAALEESRRLLREKSLRQELNRKRRMHRSEERGKINEAELKYLEDRLRNERNSDSAYQEGVILELGQAARQQAELQMSGQAVTGTVSLETAAEAAAPASDSGADISGGMSVDISI